MFKFILSKLEFSYDFLLLLFYLFLVNFSQF